MPIYNKGKYHDLIFRASRAGWRIIFYGRTFYVGQKVKVRLKIEELENAKKPLSEYGLYQQLPNKTTHELGSIIQLQDGQKKLHAIYKGKDRLIERGEYKIFLALSRDSVYESLESPALVFSAFIRHPDEERREMYIVLIAFFLAAFCAFGEILVSILAWLFPK